MKRIDIIELIVIVNRIEEKNLNAPFRCFKLMYEDNSGKHTIVNVFVTPFYNR